MKTMLMTVALLVAVSSGRAWAQAGGNMPGGRSNSATGGSVSSKQNSQSNTSGQKNGSSMGAGSARSQSGSGSQGKRRKVNQQAAGVPAAQGSVNSSASKPNRNQ